MNKCVLITSHINNEDKKNSAIDIVNFLNDKDVPVIFTGNYFIPYEIQKKVDWVLYMKENPKVDRILQYWYFTGFVDRYNKGIKVTESYLEWGYAHLLQIYRGFKLAKSLGYDYIIHLNYDVMLDNETWGDILYHTENNENIVSPWDENSFATNFFCFRADDLIPLLEQNLDYYKNLNPPNILIGWICETFFKWMITNSNVKYKIINRNFYNSNMAANDITITYKNFKFNIYYYGKYNELVLIFKGDIPNTNDIVFKVKDRDLFLEETNLPDLFILPYIEGEDYYCGDQLLFNVNHFTNQTVE
jgi:hypothetical protein